MINTMVYGDKTMVRTATAARILANRDDKHSQQWQKLCYRKQSKKGSRAKRRERERERKRERERDRQPDSQPASQQASQPGSQAARQPGRQTDSETDRAREREREMRHEGRLSTSKYPDHLYRTLAQTCLQHRIRLFSIDGP